MHNYDKTLDLKIIDHTTETAYRAQFIQQQDYRTDDNYNYTYGQYELLVSPSMLGKTFAHDDEDDDISVSPEDLPEYIGSAIIEGNLVQKQQGLPHAEGDVDFSDTYENIQPSEFFENVGGLTIKVNNPDDYGQDMPHSFFVISTLSESMNIENDNVEADTPYILTSDPIIAEALINTFPKLASKEVVMDYIEDELVERAKRPADVLFLEAALTEQAETYGIDPADVKSLTESTLGEISSISNIQKRQITDQAKRSSDIATLGRKISLVPNVATGLSQGPMQQVIHQQATRYKYVVPAGKNVLSHSSTPLVPAEATLKKTNVKVIVDGKTQEGTLYQAETPVHFPTVGIKEQNIGIAIDDGHGGNTWIAGPDDRVLASYIAPADAPSPELDNKPNVSNRIK